MPRQVTTTVYQYDELPTDRAKEKARDWYRQGDMQEDYSCEFETFADIGKLLGYDMCLKRVKLMNGSHRYDPVIYFSGFSSQGDGACFEADWSADSVDVAALKKEWPASFVVDGKEETSEPNAELHRIADELAALVAAFPTAGARIRHVGHYYHEHCTSFDTWLGEEDATEDSASFDEAFKDASRDLMRWIYRSLERDYEWRNSDECVEENIRANEYEFDEDGDRL